MFLNQRPGLGHASICPGQCAYNTNNACIKLNILSAFRVYLWGKKLEGLGWGLWAPNCPTSYSSFYHPNTSHMYTQTVKRKGVGMESCQDHWAERQVPPAQGKVQVLQACLCSWYFLHHGELPAQKSRLWGCKEHSRWSSPAACPGWDEGPSLLRARLQQQQ